VVLRRHPAFVITPLVLVDENKRRGVEEIDGCSRRKLAAADMTNEQLTNHEVQVTAHPIPVTLGQALNLKKAMLGTTKALELRFNYYVCLLQ